MSGTRKQAAADHGLHPLPLCADAANAPGYEYLRNGALASVTYPSGRKVTTAYDNLSRPIGLSAVYLAQTREYVTSATYTDHGALSTLRLSGQRIRETIGFDPNRLQITGMAMEQCLDNSLACSSPQALLNLGYTYSTGTGPLGGPNNNGSPRSQSIVGAGLSLTQTYTYDGWDRLTGMQETGSTSTLNESYCYDAFGNRAVLTRPGLSPLIPQVTSCTANDVAQLFPSNRWSGRTYDTAGALAFDGQSNLRMDAEMRLRQSYSNANPTAITTYEYDGDGRRVAKDTVGAGRTVFVYDAFGQLTAEYGGNSDLGGTPPYFLHSDALGSTRLTTDLNGTVVRRTDYWPFGREINSLTQDAPYRTTAMGYNSALRTPSTLFTGKERDAETGLDYFGARYLSGAQGRFVSPDAPFADQHVESPMSWNLYGYARNNPLRLVDPDGRQVQQAVERLTALVNRYGNNPSQALKDAVKIADAFRVVSNLSETLGPYTKSAATISRLLESERPDSDGEHDRAVGFLGSLVFLDLVPDGIEHTYYDPVTGTRKTDVDLETTYALIEVKTGEKANLRQGKIHVGDRQVNPKRKLVLLFGQR